MTFQYREALELIRDGAIPQGMSPALFAEKVLRSPAEPRAECICPTCGLRHGGSTVDGGF